MPTQVRQPSLLHLAVRQHVRASSHDVTLVPPSDHSALKERKDMVRKRKPLVPLGEVIEISSDDESPAPSIPNTIVADLRRQIKKLKEENAQCKQDLVEAEKEVVRARETVSEMQTSLQPEKGKLILDTSHVEDQLSCEVCTGRLWSPYILPECGHIFCQTCLQDWFNTTLAHFLTTHPHYDVNNPIPYLQPFQHVPQAIVHQQAPQYTCPTCRATVQNRPVEVFTVKALVRTVAAAIGENSPKKPPAAMDIRAGKNRVQGVQTMGPWDGFFQRRIRRI